MQAFFNLGVGLHFIQDSYTPVAFFSPKQPSWEVYIKAANFTYAPAETVDYYLRNKDFQRDRCYRLADSLTKKAQGRDDTLYITALSGHYRGRIFAKPIVALNIGVRKLCYH